MVCAALALAAACALGACAVRVQPADEAARASVAASWRGVAQGAWSAVTPPMPAPAELERSMGLVGGERDEPLSEARRAMRRRVEVRAYGSAVELREFLEFSEATGVFPAPTPEERGLDGERDVYVFGSGLLASPTLSAPGMDGAEMESLISELYTPGGRALHDSARTTLSFGVRVAEGLDAAPAAEQATAARGVVLYAPAVSGNEFVEPLLEELRRRGWIVAQVRSFGWRGPTPGGDIRPGLENASWNPFEPDKWVSRGADATRAADELAEATDAFVGDLARGWPALLAALEADAPALRDKPVVLIAASGGALHAPATAALLGERLSAVVIIGGAGSVLGVMRDGVIDGINDDLAEVRRRLRAARVDAERYHARSALDPMATAAALARVPTLLVQASGDQIVPAKWGEVLWERAGRPERWLRRGGHYVLFLKLGGLAGPMADWVERAVGARP